MQVFNATLLHVQDEYTKDVVWKDEARKIKQHFKMAEEYALSQIDQLETLVVSDRKWCFPVVSTLGGISTPFPFFNTLKRIHISQREAETNDLFAARNAIFILTFCPNLTQAVLGFTLTPADYDYLAEYQEGYFQKSRVKQLAIAPIFFHNRKTNTRFWMENKRFGTWKGGNKMTETIWNFLSVTNGLDSLEIVPTQTRVADQTTVFTGALSSLTSSYSTLKHLRLLSVCPIEAENNNGSEHPYMNLSKFKNLKILGLDLMTTAALRSWNSRNVPPNLETIQLVCYDSSSLSTPGSGFQEELMMVNSLQQLVQSLQLPNLTKVVLPYAPIDYSGNRPPPYLDVSGWSSIRNRSVNSPLFADGKVQLKALRPNEILGDESKGEVCLSSFGWIHSFCF